MKATSSRTVNAPLPVVRNILLEPLSLPDWNPAFLAMRGPHTATEGVHYPVQVRGGLSGYWEYRLIADTVIEGYWEVPGLSETNTWEFQPHGRGTYITHSFQHRGALAAVLRPAFAGVARLRLDRLADRAQGRAQAGIS